MTTADESCKSTGHLCPVTTTPPLLTGTGFHELISSAADSLVSHSVAPGSSEARMMTVTSGRKWSAALTLSGPLGSLARTCLESSIWHSTKCVLTWKVSATKSGRSVYRLVPSMPRISGNGSGLWPTLSAQMAGDNEDFLSSLQTKNGEPWQLGQRAYNPATGVHVQKTLNRAVKMWPTPTMGDYRSPNLNPAKKGQIEPASGHALPAKVGGQLNPTWVEWLMGYPVGWTDLGDSVTPSSRRSRKR